MERRRSSRSDPLSGRRLERWSGYGDEDTHAHNTLSAENAEVQVFYPFHPLYGATVQILRKPKRGDGAVSVIDQAGKRLKIPVWMLSPDSSGIKISERVHLNKEALLSLTSLLSPHAGEDRGHDNLLATVVDGCKGGHRGATRTVGPDVREESVTVPIDVTVRADLIDLMARVLLAIFQAKGGRVDDRALCSPKIKPEHLARKAIVYLRQSSEKQVRYNLESQRLQYEVADRIRNLGWRMSRSSIVISVPVRGWRRLAGKDSSASSAG